MCVRARGLVLRCGRQRLILHFAANLDLSSTFEVKNACSRANAYLCILTRTSRVCRKIFLFAAGTAIIQHFNIFKD